MIRWLLYLALAVTAGIGLANEGLAIGTASNANAQTAAHWCYGLIGSGGASGASALISPLIECFTDTTQGIIPSVTIQFLNNIQADYVPIVGIMCLIAIAYYGARIMIGDVQRLKASTFILGLKMGGIYIFLNNAPAIYTDMVNILQQLALSVSNAATTAHSSGFCIGAGASGSSAADNSQWQQGLWGRWDCIFQYLLGLGKAGFAATSIASFLFLMIFSASAGVVIFFIGVYLLMMLLQAAFRFIHIYLMAFLSLSFMFCLGYLLVPLLLFRNTFDYFKKWLTLVFGFILTPVIMFGFMGMMLVALDIALFSGKYSVFCTIGGPSYCGATANAASGATLFQTLTQRVEASGTFDNGNSNPNLTTSLARYIYIALDNPASLEGASGSGGVACTSQNAGWMGFICNMGGISGSAYLSSGHYETAPMGAQIVALNLSLLASGAGSTCNLLSLGSGGSGIVPISYYNNCPYLENILVSICVAALLTWIMMSLLTYIPTIASNLTQDLVQQDITQIGSRAVQSSVFGGGGGGGVQGALGIGKAAAMGAAKGSQGGGGVGGALSGGMSGSMRMLDSLLMGDR